MQAAGRVRSILLDRASELLEAATADLVLGESGVSVVGSPSRSVALDELVGDGIRVEDRFECSLLGFPYGAHIAAVEVDTGTGHIDVYRYGVGYDVGRAINPALLRGQIAGGFAQGLGGALLEQFHFDEWGQPQSASFMDYLLPTAQEVPDVQMLVTEDAPTPLNPLGVKGAGEAGTAAVGAAIANAVSDALGCEVTRLPLTPELVVDLARSVSSHDTFLPDRR